VARRARREEHYEAGTRVPGADGPCVSYGPCGHTIAGGVTLDDTLWHFSNEALPFGGVGASGIGAYHGERGFLTFTHEKAVFSQPRFALTWLLNPPYGKRFEAVLKMLKSIA